MSLLGSLLPGILGSLNPANIVRGVINAGTGILENMSKGSPLDISGNLAKGLKTVLGDEQSAIGSIGGQNLREPTVGEKLIGAQNAANTMGMRRINDFSQQTMGAAGRNAANHKGVYSEDRTRNGRLGGAPVNEVIPMEQSIESAPAGLPDRRVAMTHTDRKKIPAVNLLNARDQYGYKSIPVEMTGVRKGAAEPKELVIPKFKAEKKKKRRARS